MTSLKLPQRHNPRTGQRAARGRVIARSLAVLFLLLFTILSLGRAQNSAAGREAWRTVEPARVYETCRRLASPEFSGRLTGQEGYTAMARWTAGLMRQWSVEPFDNSGYLQAFPTESTLVESAAMTLLPRDPTSSSPEVALEPGKDFLPLLFSDSGDRTAEAVFVGWGISAPELGYDDFAGVEIKGRFALCFRGTPDPADRRFTEHDQHRTRMGKASERGALGIIYIYDEPIANPNGDWIRGFTPAVVGSKTADAILAPRKIQSETLRADLLKYKRPLSFSTGTRIRYAVRSIHTPEATGYNILGVLRGSDPALRKEYVLIGAHADHCGRFMRLLFPGANDNASGTAAVLEVARVLAAAAQRPKRSVVIALFGGEESGLKGSEYLAAHLPPGLGKPAFMLNFDMVGAGDGIRCGYSDTPELKKLIDEIAAEVPTFRGGSAIRSIGVRGSDFAPFFSRGIPCLSFASNGPHFYYHQAGDTIYRVNPDIMADAARIGLLAASKLAGH